MKHDYANLNKLVDYINRLRKEKLGLLTPVRKRSTTAFWVPEDKKNISLKDLAKKIEELEKL